MLIDCPSCATCYQVDATAFAAGGRSLVCSACDARWFVEAPGADMPGEQMDREPIEIMAAPEIEAEPDRFRDTKIVFDQDFSAFAKPEKPAIAVRARRPRAFAPPPPRHFSALRQFAVGAACLALAMGVIGKRTAIVQILPRTAGLYAALGLPVNVRNLDITDVKTVRLAEGEARVEVSGVIRNLAHGRTAVPHISFDVRDAAGKTLSTWSEGAPKRVLASNETLAFATQVPDLPAGSKDVVVRFATNEEAAPKASSLLIHKSR